MKNKSHLSLIITGLTIFILLAAVALMYALTARIQKVDEREEIRIGAVTPGGVGRISLSPSTVTKYPGDTFSTVINFQTGTNPANAVAISSIALRITYPYSGPTPELDVVDSVGDPSDQIYPDSALAGSGDWAFPVKSVSRSGGIVTIDLAAVNYSIPGYTTSTPTPLAIIYFKANQEPTTNPIVLSFDSSLTKMMTKADPATDILDVPVNGTYTIQEDTLPPTAFNLLSPNDNSWVATYWPTLSWNASSDAQTGLAKYQLFINGSLAVDDIPPTQTSQQAPSLDHGSSNPWYVVAFDNAGNQRQSTNTWTVRIDTTPPTTPVVNDEGATTPDPTQLYADWSATDPQSGITGYEYKITKDAPHPTGTTIVNWTSAGLNTSVTHTGLNLSYGPLYYFSVRATNAVGLESNVGSSDGIEVEDTQPPAAVTDLTISGATKQSVTLSWRAPADSGPDGRASSYDLRYSTSLITEANWLSATPATGLPQPSAPGTLQTFTVPSLAAGTRYYFALKSADAAGNISNLSNVASDNTSPATLTFGFRFQGVSGSGLSKSMDVTLKGPSPKVYSDVVFVSDATAVFRPSTPIPLTDFSIPSAGVTVNVLVKDIGHLRKQLGSLTLMPSDNVAPLSWDSVIVRAGDFNDNNHLTIDDIGAILSVYTALSIPVTSGNQIYDVNLSNFIDIEDVALVLTNYTALDVPGDE